MNKNEYARSNKEWLAGKAKEDGVTQLAKGVCYKVLQSGPEGGKQPTPNSVVSCHYLGRTIDGKCFDTSPRAGISPPSRCYLRTTRLPRRMTRWPLL